MKIIKSTNGYEILVDDSVYAWASKYRWSVNSHSDRDSKTVMHTRTHIAMHRLIMGNPRGKFVDHIDGNQLNNQRSNLRLCTNSQNLRNQKINSRNTSGYKGVTFRKDRNKFRAIILDRFIGYYDTAIDAAKAYNQAAIKEFGEFARLNIL